MAATGHCTPIKPFTGVNDLLAALSVLDVSAQGGAMTRDHDTTTGRHLAVEVVDEQERKRVDKCLKKVTRSQYH